MLLQKTTTMKSCIGIYVVVATISILEASASPYGTFASPPSSFAQPQWSLQPTTQTQPGLTQPPAQNWASKTYQQPTYQSNSYSSSGSASSAYQNTPSPFNAQPLMNTYTLPLSPGGSLNQNGAFNGQTSYLSSNYPLAFGKPGYAINQQRIASASNAGARSSAGFPILNGISNSYNSYLPYKNPLGYGSQGPALFKQGSASSAAATTNAVAASSIQNRLNAGQNMYFTNPLKYGNYGLGLTQQGNNAVSNAQGAAISGLYPVQPSSQSGGILNSDDSSRIKFLSVPLSSQRTQTLHLPINIKDSNVKVIHRNEDGSNAHGGISSEALDYLSKINTDFKQIESNPQSFTEMDYPSQQISSQSQAQATSNSGFGNIGTGNNPQYGKRDIEGTATVSDAQATSSATSIRDSHPVQPYGNINSDELSKIKSSLPSTLKSLGLPFNIKDAHLRVIHRNPIATDDSKAQSGISSDALEYLSKISSEFGEIESNPESFSETDYPSQPITQQSTSQSIAKATSNSATSSAAAGSSNQDATHRYPQGYSPAYTKQGIAGASDAQATSNATAGSSNQDGTHNYPQRYGPSYTQQGVAGPSSSQTTASAAASFSNLDETHGYPQGYDFGSTQQGIAGASDAQATSSAAAGSLNQDETHNYPHGYGPSYTQQGVAGASDAKATSNAATGSSNLDGTYGNPQGYGPGSTQQGIPGASDAQATSSATAGASNADGTYGYPQRYSPAYKKQGIDGASDAKATSNAATGSLNLDGTYGNPQGYGPGSTQQGIPGASEAQATTSATAGSSNQDGTHNYPQGYGPSYTQQGVASPSSFQARASAAAGSLNQYETHNYPQRYGPSYTQQGVAGPSSSQTTASAAASFSNLDETHGYPQRYDFGSTQQGIAGASDAQATSSAAAGSLNQDERHNYPHGYGPSYTQQGIAGASDAKATSNAATGSSNLDGTYGNPQGYGPGSTQQGITGTSDAQATSSATAGSSTQNRYPQSSGPGYIPQGGESDTQATSSAAAGSSNQDGTNSNPQEYGPRYTKQGVAGASDAQAISSDAADISYQDAIYSSYPQENVPNKQSYYGVQKGSTTNISGTSASSVSQSKASSTTSGDQGVVSYDGKPNTAKTLMNRQNIDELDLEIPINDSNLQGTPGVIANNGTPVKDNIKNKYRDQEEPLYSDDLDLDKDWQNYDDQSEVPNFKDKETDYNNKNSWLGNQINWQTYENSGKYPNEYEVHPAPIDNLYAYTTLAPTDTQSTRYYQPHLGNQHHKIRNPIPNKKPYPGNFPNYSQTTVTNSFTSSQDYEQGSTPLYELTEDGWGGLTTNTPFSNNDGIDRNVYSNGFIQPTLDPFDFSIPNKEASDSLYYLPNFKQKTVDSQNKYKPIPSNSPIYPYYGGDVTETPYPTTWAPQNNRNKKTGNQLNVFGASRAEADATSSVKSQNTAIPYLANKYPGNIESATYYPKDIQSSTVYYSTQGNPTTEYPFDNFPTKDYSSIGFTELYPANTGSPIYRGPINKYQYNKHIPNTTPNFTKQDKQYDAKTGFDSSVTNSLPSLTSQKTTDAKDSNATESSSIDSSGSNTKKKGISAASFFKTLFSEVRKQKYSKTSTKKCGKCDDDDVPSDLEEPEYKTSSEEFDELMEQTNDSDSKPAVSNISKLISTLFG